jgi:hypothetical protein
MVHQDLDDPEVLSSVETSMVSKFRKRENEGQYLSRPKGSKATAVQGFNGSTVQRPPTTTIFLGVSETSNPTTRMTAVPAAPNGA